MKEDIQELKEKVDALDVELKSILQRQREIMEEMKAHPERFLTFKSELADLRARTKVATAEKHRLVLQLERLKKQANKPNTQLN